MTRMRWLGAALLTAGLLAALAQGAWPLGFVALVPWLVARAARPGWRQAWVDGWLLSVLVTGAGFAWFGTAMGRYTGWGEAVGLLLLLLAAPVFQPQCLVFALLRRAALPWGPAAAAATGAAGWLAAEWLLPKVLGDSWGLTLYPAPWLRQVAAWVGVSGLTLWLLGANEALALLWQRRGEGWRGLRGPRGMALAVGGGLSLALMAAGAQRWHEPPPAGPVLRAGLVQAAMDGEALRRQHGTGEALRRVLDRHFAMSFDAVERQGAQLLLWSETVVPTSFGAPRNAAGAAFDQELLATVRAGGVPLLFGTFERDAGREYNAAVLLDPQQGRVGSYRKTRLFPFSEGLPAPLDGLRRVWPGLGGWQPGDGARVLPLTLIGRDPMVVAPLICRDATDPALARDAARLGAQLLLTLSNDAWFTADGASLGARLHLASAAFRSVETGLPQFRVTHTGVSAVIDARGAVLARGEVGEPTLVVGELTVPAAPDLPLATRWGDWVSLLATAALGGLALLRLAAWIPVGPVRTPPSVALPVRVQWVPPLLRAAAVGLRGLSRLAVLGLAAWVLLDENARLQAPSTLRWLLGAVLLPEAAAWCLLRAGQATLLREGGEWRLMQGGACRARGHGLTVDAVWHWPWPAPGLTLRLDGRALHLAHPDPVGLWRTLEPSRAPRSLAPPPRGWAHPAARFGALPLGLALAAFHLHQHIAYGSVWGEALSFGWRAWFTTLGLWWGGWLLVVLGLAAVWRTGLELGGWLLGRWWPQRVPAWRGAGQRLGLLGLYLGLPLWLAWRTL